MRGVLRFAWLLGAASTAWAAHDPCAVALGVLNNHAEVLPDWSPPRTLFTVYTPMPSAPLPGVLLDLARKQPHEIFPRRFIIGDGGDNRPFMLVDLNEGSPLDHHVGRVLRHLKRRGMNADDPESVFDFLHKRLGNYLSNDGSSGDQPSLVGEEAQRIFAGQNVPNAPLSGTVAVPTGQRYPVIRFEDYFTRGNAVCIQKVLLAAFILERLRIPHKVVTGFTTAQPGAFKFGHSWIELADGRILDPEHKVMAWPTPHERYPLLLKVGEHYRQANTHYPYFVPISRF
jgi:hypothetical protein